MKRNMYRLLLFSVLIIMVIFVQAQNEYGVVFKESFEEGIPEGWTQEHKSGTHDWVVESGDLSCPNGAYKGDNRIALRNETSATIGYKTKLISPVMDLSKLFQPILKFAHAQDQWTGDFDTLRVYYRADTTRNWSLVPLGEYSHYISKWEYETITLPSKSSTYQVAFEGTDNMGRGIVLDDIMVRSEPNCVQPFNVVVKEVLNSSATLRWEGPFDAKTFLVKVHSDSIPIEDLDVTKADAFDDEVHVVMPYTQVISDLNPGKVYYVYIKSICSEESSAWSEVFEFSTYNISNIPYKENFDITINPGLVTRLNNWTYGASSNVGAPYINTNNSESQLGSWSRDTTTALVFNGSESSSSVLQKGDFTYCATPEMNIDKVSTLQVSFWSRYNEFKADHYKLRVGVMTNPRDITTFVDVETVEITKYREFQEFIVPLSSYSGKGKYIGLLAQFADGTNQFFLDDFKVDFIPSCSKASEIKVSQKSATEATISWLAGEATHGDIIVSETAINIADIATTTITYPNVINSYQADNLEPWTKYYVYVRNVCGEKHGEWSNEVTFLTPDTIIALPHSFNFKINISDHTTYYNPMNGNSSKLSVGLIALHNQANPPCIVDNRTNFDLAITATDDTKYTYVIFPELPNLKQTTVEFLARKDEDFSGVFEVGVMEDVNDISSFAHVDSIEAKEIKRDYRVNLSQYKESGKFFAIRVFYDNRNAKGTKIYFDSLVFSEKSTCNVPSNIKVEPKDTTVSILWDANGASSWEVRLSHKALLGSSLNKNILNDYVFIDTVSTDSISILNLLANETTYYYYIKPICGADTGSWTLADYFKTDCYSKNSLPYTMDFEGYPVGNQNREFSIPCLFTKKESYGSNNYPYLEGYYYSNNSDGCLCLSSGTYYPVHNDYIAFPILEDSINKLQLTMMIYSTNTSHKLYVGVMGDPNSQADFDTLHTINASKTYAYEKVIIPFTKYKGKGQYIALSTEENTETSFYIDDIKIEYKSPCAKVYSPEIISVIDTSVVLSWTPGDDEQQWNVIVSTNNNLSAAQREAALLNPQTEDIAFAGVANSIPFAVSKLMDETQYYFYVQAKCSATLMGEWSNSIVNFKTACSTKEVGALGVEDFDACGTGSGNYPYCWKVGNEKTSSSTYIPYCVTTYKHEGTASLQFYTEAGENGAYAISPRIDIDSINRLQVSFWGSCAKTSYARYPYQHQLVVGVVTSPDTLSSFMPIDTITGYADEQYYTISLSNYKGDYDEGQGKYVMFTSNFDKENYFFIDNVSFDTIPDCQYPEDIEIDALTHDSIAIFWVKGTAPYSGKISTRQLLETELNETTVPEDVSVFDMKVIGTKAQCARLTPDTKYYLYVSSTCEDGKSWSSPIRFTTGCKPYFAIPFIENFNSYTQTGTGYKPNCWISYYSNLGEENNYPHIHNSGRENTKGLYIYANSPDKQSYAVTPLLDVEDISKCQVSFWAKPSSSYQRSVIVGLATDVSTVESIVSTFEAIDTIKEKSDSYNKYIVSLKDNTRGGKYVVFTTDFNSNLSSSGTGYAGGMYIDDIEIDTIPSCATPDFVTVVGASPYDLSLTVKGGASSGLWEVEYGARGFILGEGTDTTVTNRDFQLLGLTQNTEYDVYVRTVCGSKDKSELFGPISTKTKVLPVSDYPYEHDFDGEVENKSWTLLNGTEANKWYIGGAYSKDGNGLYISNDGGVTGKYNSSKTSYTYAVRPFLMQKGEYTFEFDWICYGGYSDYIRIGLLPITATFNAGSNKVQQDDGQTEFSSYTTPSQWLSLEGLDGYGEQNDRLNYASSWQKNSVSHAISEEGLYNLVIYWTNDGWGDKNPSAAIDNIKVSYSNCLKPSKFKTDILLETTAAVSWPEDEAATEWEVFVTANKDLASPDDNMADSVLHRTVSSSNVELKNLTGSTKYYLFARTKCGQDTYSSWSEVYAFKTACSLYEIGATFGFELNEGYYVPYDNLYKAPECFVVGNNNGLQLSEYPKYFPCLTNERSSSIFSRTGKSSLFLFNNNVKYKGSYIVFPMVNENIDSLLLTFWMRPVYQYSSSNKGLSTSYAENDYAKTLTIGTMESPTDTASFLKVTDVVYPYAYSDLESKNIDDDPEKTKYWRKYSIPFSSVESGKHIVFMNDPSGYNLNAMYIDDVTIEKISSCVTPYNIEISATDSSAEITFAPTEGKSWDLMLSSNELFTDTLFCDTITASTYTINNLTENSTYYVKAQQLCSKDDKSGWSKVAQFRTLASVRFLEDFNTQIQVQKNWTRATANTSDILDNSRPTFTYQDNTSLSGWIHSARNIYTDGHQKLNVGILIYDWLFTPVVNLGSEENVHLTFDLALTEENLTTPPAKIVYGKFMVIISDDGGVTWKKENSTVWTTKDGDYSFNEISHTGDHINIDLSKYAEKNIKVAFCGQFENYSSSHCDLHIDNVNINYISMQELNDSLCQTENYSSNGFEILSDTLKIGENKFSRSKFATTDVADTVYNLTLNVKPMVETKIEATVCKGEVYSKYDFSTSKLGEQQRKLKADNGCDSVVTLNLRLIPPVTTELQAIICQGSEYIFNNKPYDRTGVYCDTLKANYTDCDSIVRVTLTVNEAITADVYEVVCFGDSIDFGKHKSITTSGEYMDTFPTLTGCDSIVTLTLEALPKINTVLNEVICAGETYDDSGFAGVSESGTYVLEDLKTVVDDCDSLVTLNLTVLNGDTSKVPLTITTKALPYHYQGEVYPEGTLPGVYTDTINVTAEGCDDVIILTLTIKLEVSVENVDYTPLFITPNPILVGESVSVEIADDLNIVSCEVYDATGALITSFSPNSKPITLNDFKTRGIYMVRLTTNTGKVFVGKILVK